MDRVEKYLALQQMPLFSSLPSEDLWRWTEHMHVRTFKPASLVLSAGRPVDGLWLRGQGSVQCGDDSLDLSPYTGFARMLQHTVAEQDWKAHPSEGCRLLAISRAEAIATLYESPRILKELMPLADFPSWIAR